MGSSRVRPIGALAALTTFLALSSLAVAQQPPGLPGQERPLTTHPERPDTVKVWVTGNFTLDYVNRPAQLTAFTPSLSNPNGLGAANSDFENTFEGEVGFRFTAEMMNMRISNPTITKMDFVSPAIAWTSCAVVGMLTFSQRSSTLIANAVSIGRTIVPQTISRSNERSLRRPGNPLRHVALTPTQSRGHGTRISSSSRKSQSRQHVFRDARLQPRNRHCHCINQPDDRADES